MKVLFVGLGSIGQRHLRNLRALFGTDVEILAYRTHGTTPVLNPDMTVRSDADLAGMYDIRVFRDLDGALSERPQAVFVTNPNTYHVPVALAAAKAGCHLFIEKPLSHALDRVEELIDVVDRQKLVALVAYQFRFHPALRAIKVMLDEGRLGRLVAAHIVNAEHLPDWHPYEDYRTSHAGRKAMGGGALRIQTHELDYALWLLGLPSTIYAVGGHLSRLEVDVEDSVSMLMCCQHAPVHIHLDYVQRPPQRICEIVGDAGRVRFDYYANELEVHELGTRARHVMRFDGFERNQMFVDVLKHFWACVRGEAEPVVDLRDACRSLRLSLLAEQSLLSGRAMACDWHVDAERVQAVVHTNLNGEVKRYG